MELLKCPFCGSDKLKVEHKNKFKDICRNFIRMSFSVRCNCCHARGGVVTRDISYNDQTNAISEAKNEAINKWNMRALGDIFVKDISDKMRDATKEEQEAIKKYIENHSVYAEVNFYYSQDMLEKNGAKEITKLKNRQLRSGI